MTHRILLSLSLVLVLPLAASGADDPETLKIMAKYQKNVDKGLQWLAKQQFRDGHWEAQGGNYPIAMTALAGMALLAEGSTPHQGRYAKELDNAVEYLLARVQKNGQIGRPDDPRENQQYMYGHGFGTMFLAQVYGEEVDERRRAKLEVALTRAAAYIGDAQTHLGGWGYVSAKESGDFDEGSVTVTQVQALRACRDAGIPVDVNVIKKAHEYLKKSTVISRRDPGNPAREEGGIIYSLRNGGGDIRPPLTAAGIACLFNAGEYKSEMAIKWLNYCQKNIPVRRGMPDSFGHGEYTHFYYAQVLYSLGEDRHVKLRPDVADKDLLKWSRYREVIFADICARQGGDGSWQGNVGPVYMTSMYLVILQLDKAALPILGR
ncbi:MAG: terpene cyclase/mutase family protein [Gemmataceae bacterium]|nr:terpene cyclase/mutase family protein [Gemmataceae bacterium]